jgi:hypothetical protein
MTLKELQLYINQHYSAIRYFVIISVMVTLLIFSAMLVSKQNRLLEDNKVLTGTVKKLSEDNKLLNQQTKQLGEENQEIGKTNQSYLRCIASIFANYTHDFVPITIDNLDTCRITADSSAVRTSDGSASTTQSVPSEPLSGVQAENNSSSNTIPERASPQSNNVQPPDNDGWILNLPDAVPLLPNSVHIPSPF